jgi:hypothetical protein
MQGDVNISSHAQEALVRTLVNGVMSHISDGVQPKIFARGPQNMYKKQERSMSDLRHS